MPLKLLILLGKHGFGELDSSQSSDAQSARGVRRFGEIKAKARLHRKARSRGRVSYSLRVKLSYPCQGQALLFTKNYRETLEDPTFWHFLGFVLLLSLIFLSNMPPFHAFALIALLLGRIAYVAWQKPPPGRAEAKELHFSRITTGVDPRLLGRFELWSSSPGGGEGLPARAHGAAPRAQIPWHGARDAARARLHPARRARSRALPARCLTTPRRSPAR